MQLYYYDTAYHISPNLFNLYLFWTEYATVGYMAKRIQMRKNRFLAIQKMAEQKKSGHDTLSHAQSHQQSRSSHGNMSGHNTISGHNTLTGHNTMSHGLSGHGLPPSHIASYGGHDSHPRHSHSSHSGHGGQILSGDMDHLPRQAVSVFVISDLLTKKKKTRFYYIPDTC